MIPSRAALRRKLPGRVVVEAKELIAPEATPLLTEFLLPSHRVDKIWPGAMRGKGSGLAVLLAEQDDEETTEAGALLAQDW